ncbi:MAG: hypothetical protein SFV52_03225 [Saprospiraceae bacterium]|nr:hypothetical protein [Saprospiraceae bacterium]
MTESSDKRPAIEEIKATDFNGYLFWDADPARIDLEKSKAYVIERVLSHGMVSDWRLLNRLYDRQTLLNTVLQLRYLDKRSLHFCAAYFDVPIEDFRCYTYAQSNPAHWNY